LLMLTDEPVSVGHASGEEPEDWPPDDGPLLVPFEGAGQRADVLGLLLVGLADQLGELEDEVQETHH
jgi:hypothetical protein